MSKSPKIIVAVAGMLAAMLFSACPAEQGAQVSFDPPPVTEKGEVVDMLHGKELPDPYRWLEDQQAEKTREWIGVQNEYTDSILKKLPGREELHEVFSKLAKIDTISAPFERGGKYFYTKRAADQDLGVIYVRDGLEGEERVLLDPHTLSEDHSISTGMAGMTKDGMIMTYSVRKGGVDEVEYRFKNVETGEDLEDVLPTARYFGAALTDDKEYLYYTRHGAEGPRTYVHKMGDDFANDKLIFGEGYGPEYIIYAGPTEDEKYLLATVVTGSSGSQKLFYKETNGKEWKTILDDGKSKANITEAGDKYIIWTDMDAPNGRLMIADRNAPEAANWKEFLPEDKEAVLRGASAIGGHIVASYLKDVQTVAKIYDMEGNLVRDVDLGDMGSFGLGGRWDSDEAFATFSSFHVPPTIYRYDMKTGESTVWDRIEVPVDSDSLELKQVFYTSKDGTKVPMFIIHKKGLELNGKNPTILNGYGGFNVSLTPRFNSNACAWAELGGVYAIANLRGGGEYGEEWHQAGMLKNKQNTFDDFYAAAEYLIAEKYTSAKNLGCMGGSNGGLLVGAAMTQRPELFGAVVCVYPLLDMVRYHKFLVGSYWIPEYGNADNEADFANIYAYSPYHNVKKGIDYPATLFISGDGDTRVDPLHARKMAALTQELNSGKNPIMLRYHIKAGHSGGMPVKEQIENNVDTFSFLKWQLSK